MARILLADETLETAAAFQRVAYLYSKDELKFVQSELRKGRIDGGTYRQKPHTCGCFFGAIAAYRGIEGGLYVADRCDASSKDISLVENFFASLYPGDKPKNSPKALKADRWLTKAITGKSV